MEELVLIIWNTSISLSGGIARVNAHLLYNEPKIGEIGRKVLVHISTSQNSVLNFREVSFTYNKYITENI